MFYLVKDFGIGHTYSKIERTCMHTAIESVNQIIIVHISQLYLDGQYLKIAAYWFMPIVTYKYILMRKISFTVFNDICD